MNSKDNHWDNQSLRNKKSTDFTGTFANFKRSRADWFIRRNVLKINYLTFMSIFMSIFMSNFLKILYGFTHANLCLQI
jgi:hypothetical protein